MADLNLMNTGAFTVLTPTSDRGREWLADNLDGEQTRYGQCSIIVERPYLAAIVDGAINDGLDLS